MAKNPGKRPERSATDNTLASERDKTDAELAKKQSGVEQDADAVQVLARKRADAIQRTARDSADAKLRRSDPDAGVSDALSEERSREDGALAEERAAADDALASERGERRRALTALLQLERDQTDAHLAFERGRIDEVIASRDDFLGMASHDLRNNLGTLAISAAALLALPCDEALAEQLAQIAQRVQRTTVRMNRLVGDLLDVVSIEAGRLAIVPSRHDAGDLLQETSEAFQPVAAAKNIAIRTEVRGDSLLARYDHDRILQVLANLVGNAVKFSRDAGTIDISVESVDSDVRFAVTDTGVGMDAAALAIVFERFGQADRRSRSGLGLGLYIARCIIEAHGGRIWAESRPGKGSTFYFTLPGAGRSTSDVQGEESGASSAQ